MPTFTRLLLALVILIALIYGAMVGLVYLVKPLTTDITIDIPPDNLHLRDRPSASQPAGILQTDNVQPSNPQTYDQQNSQQPVNQPKSSQNSSVKAAQPIAKEDDQ